MDMALEWRRQDGMHYKLLILNDIKLLLLKLNY